MFELASSQDEFCIFKKSPKGWCDFWSQAKVLAALVNDGNGPATTNAIEGLNRQAKQFRCKSQDLASRLDAGYKIDRDLAIQFTDSVQFDGVSHRIGFII